MSYFRSERNRRKLPKVSIHGICPMCKEPWYTEENYNLSRLIPRPYASNRRRMFAMTCPGCKAEIVTERFYDLDDEQYIDNIDRLAEDTETARLEQIERVRQKETERIWHVYSSGDSCNSLYDDTNHLSYKDFRFIETYFEAELEELAQALEELEDESDNE